MSSTSGEHTVATTGGQSMMSKRRFAQVRDMIHEVVADPQKSQEIISRLCTIMNFDPEKKVYNEGYARRIREWRQRHKQTKDGGNTIGVTQEHHCVPT